MSLNQRATAEFSTYVHQVLLKPATYPSKHIIQVTRSRLRVSSVSFACARKSRVGPFQLSR